jgi:endonuclease G
MTKGFLVKGIKILFFLTPLLYTSLFSQSFTPTHKGEIIKHNYFTLSYIEKHEQAEWVHYLLTKEMIEGPAKRKDNFKADPLVSTGSASPKDYVKSGYDRGHLAPAADMKIDDVSMSESFYMTNMSPQTPSFNRGGWKKIEALVRTWAKDEDVYVTVGGILTKDLKKIGEGVSVPEYFYKIIFNPKNNKVIAFYTPNSKLVNSIETYVVAVDEIEKITNIDFLSDLKDDLEDEIESSVNKANWPFDN